MELDKVLTTGNLDLLLGKQVMNQLSDDKFSREWDNLFSSCPWATVFQSRPYVTSWYETYHTQHLPILLKFEQNGKLLGVFPLTQLQESSVITGAGAEFAEYHGWLTDPAWGKQFIRQALLDVARHFPGCRLELKYLPPKAPVEWLKDQYTYGRLRLEAHKRPYIDLEDVNAQKHLQKKELRNKLNRLKRLGAVQFEQITEVNHFESVFEAIKCQFEFRKAVKYNFYPFGTDPARKAFFMRLFRHNLLDVSVLKLNDVIIASIIATKGKGILHFAGMITYHPFYSKYSPGILNILLLNQSILKDGTMVFDLSPGGDKFKERLSNSFDQVYTLTQSSFGAGVLESSLCYLKSNIRNTLNYLGFNTQRIRQYVSIRMNRAGYIRNHGRLPIWGMPTSRQAAVKLEFPRHYSEGIMLNQNQLCDLLFYDQRNSSSTKWDFLQEAAQRLKCGEHVLTYAENEILRFCVWKLELKKQHPDFLHLPIGAVVLYGLYYHPDSSHDLCNYINAACQTVSPTSEVFLVADSQNLNRTGLINKITSGDHSNFG